MSFKRGLAKFRPVPAPRVVIDRHGGTCATCLDPIAPGSRVVLSYVRGRTPDAWAEERVSHEACAQERAS